jgi:hypothetical protein
MFTSYRHGSLGRIVLVRGLEPGLLCDCLDCCWGDVDCDEIREIGRFLGRF